MEKLRAYLKTLNTEQQIDFAARCGTTIGYLRKAMSKGAQFKTDLAINIERESDRAVTVEHLIPSADWEFIREIAA